MKIAIMTQPLGHNYGGIMQAFALQKVLKGMGHDIVTIDYNSPQPKFFYKKARFFYRCAKKAIGKYEAPINIEKHLPYILQNTQSFIGEYILQSEYIDSTEKLKKNVKNNKYDAFIVGSDQTWRPKYSPNIYDYYLNFLSSKSKAKRIAYASSFGVDTWEYTAEETKTCAKLASAFDAISVREQSGIDLCKNYLDVDSVCVLDPTLLLDKKDYLDIIGESYEKNENGGVFTYFLDKNKEKINIAELISKELNFRTYSCQSIKSLKTLKNYSLDDYIMPKVQEWLSSFANANFVLTDSFHGMVFSIIFEKPFLVIVNKERGAARFESLLSQIGGLNHLIYNPTEISNKIDEIRNIKPLDKRLLLTLKEESLGFLKNSINDNK